MNRSLRCCGKCSCLDKDSKDRKADSAEKEEGSFREEAIFWAGFEKVEFSKWRKETENSRLSKPHVQVDRHVGRSGRSREGKWNTMAKVSWCQGKKKKTTTGKGRWWPVCQAQEITFCSAAPGEGCSVTRTDLSEINPDSSVVDWRASVDGEWLEAWTQSGLSLSSECFFLCSVFLMCAHMCVCVHVCVQTLGCIPLFLSFCLWLSVFSLSLSISLFAFPIIINVLSLKHGM